MSDTDELRGAAGDPGSPAAPPRVPPQGGPPGPAWTTVTTGRRFDPVEQPVRTGRIVAQVVAAAAVVVLAVGAVGSVASRNVAEREAVTDAAHTTDLLADAVVQPALEDGLLAGTSSAVARIDAVVRAQVLGPSIVRVKIWGPDGRILYSDEPRIIGQTFNLGDEERSVLTDPTTRAEVSDLQRPENLYEQGQGKLLEVYRPVWTPSGQALLFETYSPYASVTGRTGQLWRGFAGITLTSLLLLVLLLMPVLWRLLDRLRRAQSHREALLKHAVDASAEERRRIAATLHDGVVQELAATSFAVAGAAERAEAVQQPELARALKSAAATVRASISGLRSLLVDIYPPSLRTAGLAAALDDLAATIRSRSIEVTLDLPADGSTGLDSAGEQLVFRVAQECLRNVARHSAASHVQVSLRPEGSAIVLEITDDGVGFDPGHALSSAQQGHFGLRVLTDLATVAGAELQVSSAPGAGTRWRLTVPS